MKDLITPVLNGMVDAVHEVNPDAEIYINSPINTKPNANGFFYIQFPVSIIQDPYLQDFHRLRLSFDVAYFPPDLNGDNALLLSNACFAISEALRRIHPAEFVNDEYRTSSRPKRGFGIHTELVDGVAHVLGAYDIFVDTVASKDFVRDITISLKKQRS